MDTRLTGYEIYRHSFRDTLGCVRHSIPCPVGWGQWGTPDWRDSGIVGTELRASLERGVA